MRKKTHVLLAGFLAGEQNCEGLLKHKKAFYLGSVLPDLNPKMLAVPHEYNVTYPAIRRCLSEILSEAEKGECEGRVLWRRLGIVFHYLADYFTFPHNTIFSGTLKEHCRYEGEMKYRMRMIIWSQEAGAVFRLRQPEAQKIRNSEMLFDYIEEMHRCYIRQENEHTPADDCRWIIELCSTVMAAVAGMVSTEEQAVQYRCA